MNTMSHEPLMPLPRGRRLWLFCGTLLMLCVYYLDYGAGFHEGTAEESSFLSFPVRVLAVALITASLAPFRSRPKAPWALIGLYGVAATSFALSIGLFGEANDILFLNTLLQLPILWALCQTRWDLDYPRWLRFIGAVYILQACIDLTVLVQGQSLWLSEAFVGGSGNPSSFGISCVLLVAFFLLHPQAGRGALPKAVLLSGAALMTKSLFAALGLVIVYGVWALHDRRRLLAVFLVMIGGAVAVDAWLASHDQEIFVVHKLEAAAAFVGLMSYDIDTSLSVTARSEMHERTLDAIENEPTRLLSGHLEGLAYWPNDSEVLTYLGSFGVIVLVGFLALHLLWMGCALRNRRVDGKFTLVGLSLFGLIFFTNRILDYFPIATLYFICIVMATRRSPLSLRAGARNPMTEPLSIPNGGQGEADA
jgi:hypothetical protein